MMGLSGTFINLVFAGHYTHEGDSGDKSIVFAGVSLANVSVSCFGLSSFFFLLSSFFYQIIPSFFAFADVGECDVFIFINWYEQCCWNFNKPTQWSRFDDTDATIEIDQNKYTNIVYSVYCILYNVYHIMLRGFSSYIIFSLPVNVRQLQRSRHRTATLLLNTRCNVHSYHFLMDLHFRDFPSARIGEGRVHCYKELYTDTCANYTMWCSHRKLWEVSDGNT